MLRKWHLRLMQIFKMQIVITPLKNRIVSASLTGIFVYILSTTLLRFKTFSFAGLASEIIYQVFIKCFISSLNFKAQTPLETQLLKIVLSVFASVLLWSFTFFEISVGVDNFNTEAVSFYIRDYLFNLSIDAFSEKSSFAFFASGFIAGFLSKALFFSPKIMLKTAITLGLNQLIYNYLLEMNTITLECRDLTAEDVPSASELSIRLSPESLHASRSVENFLNNMKDPANKLYGACIGHRVISFVETIGPKIRLVYTDPEFQKLGLAKTLLEHVIEGMELPINLRASRRGRKLYEDLGFVVKSDLIVKGDCAFYEMVKE